MDGERVLAEAAEAYRVALGERLVAAYALGSMAHGGFSELVSDVDLGLIVSEPLRPGDGETIQAVAETEKRKGSALHERLSVFWGTPITLRGEQDGGRFPALDRLDLIENGRVLSGSDDARRGLPRPSAREVLITGAEFALDYLAGVRRPGAVPTEKLGSMRFAGEDAIEEILFPDLLLGRGLRRVTKLVLFPVRFIYTAATGHVGTNGAAVARYLEDYDAPSTRLVAAALAWRTAPPPDQAAASELLREQMVQLYLYYIDDQVERLGSIGEIDLASAFREWRDRLVRGPEDPSEASHGGRGRPSASSRGATGGPMAEPLNVAEFERLAEERLDPGTWGYYAGGAGDEITLRDNLSAFGRWTLRPRVLVDVGAVTSSTTVLGHEVSMPLLVAPTAFHRLANADGEVATARAAAAAGTIMCLSSFATSTPAEVAAAGGTRWYQLYLFKDAGFTNALIEQAREQGFSALVLTVDAPVLGRRERELRTGFTVGHLATSVSGGGVTPAESFALMSPSVTWKDVQAFASASPLPVVVKGILTAESARLACEHGAAALVVSNHGGRQLDGVPATLDALPEVLEAVDGRIEVYLDGGVRRGIDVAKALALGARATLIGRPVLWALAVDGEPGARRLLELLRTEIELTLALLGCTNPQYVQRDHVARRL